MTLELVLKFGHVLCAIVWLGGGLALTVVAARARASGDPVAIREFAGTLSYVALRLLTPAVIGTIGFGVALVLVSSAWDFGQTWILIALGLFGVAFAIGVGYLARIGQQLGRLGADQGQPTTGAEALLGRWILGYRLVLIVLAVIVWDMIAKPGL